MNAAPYHHLPLWTRSVADAYLASMPLAEALADKIIAYWRILMRYVLAFVAFGSVALAPQMAAAQDASFYRCENKAVQLDIPAMPLGEALEKFTAATRCPVSIDAEQVAGNDPRIVPSFRVKGRMLPAKALRQMLSASPLKSRVIKGGFSIYYN